MQNLLAFILLPNSSAFKITKQQTLKKKQAFLWILRILLIAQPPTALDNLNFEWRKYGNSIYDLINYAHQ